jgi:hypothetical protein
VTQALLKNVRYGVSIWIDAPFETTVAVLDSAGTTTFGSRSFTDNTGGYVECLLEWTQPSDATAYRIQVTAHPASGGENFDTITVGRMRSTVIDRRAFRRTKILPVQSALTQAGAEQIGDTYLLNHKTTPLKGSLSVTGQGGVRRVLGGAAVHPAHLLKNTTEFIRFSHRIDPDTGNHGREGRIASVSYTHTGEKASVQIDNDRQNFEALLARLGALTG